MDNKKYLKWYNKIGYGSGDIAGNIVYAFLATFVMIYLTDTAGLNAGIVGTLMMVSKIFDGFTDIIFGSLIYKTKTKINTTNKYIGYTLDKIEPTIIPDIITSGEKIKIYYVRNTYKLTINPNGGTWNNNSSSQEFSLKYQDMIEMTSSQRKELSAKANSPPSSMS